jgi:hypothetical protein
MSRRLRLFLGMPSEDARFIDDFAAGQRQRRGRNRLGPTTRQRQDDRGAGRRTRGRGGQTEQRER